MEFATTNHTPSAAYHRIITRQMFFVASDNSVNGAMTDNAPVSALPAVATMFPVKAMPPGMAMTPGKNAAKSKCRHEIAGISHSGI